MIAMKRHQRKQQEQELHSSNALFTVVADTLRRELSAYTKRLSMVEEAVALLPSRLVTADFEHCMI